MLVALVASDGCFGSGVASLLDIIGTADHIRAGVDESIPSLELEVVARRRRVSTSSGLIGTATGSLSELASFDVVIVPGFGTMTGEATSRSRSRRWPPASAPAGARSNVTPMPLSG